MKLQVGSKAPDFTVNDQDGNPVKLSDLRGKKVVLYFYPKDMTEGCTAQACNLRDNYTLLRNHGFEIVGISPNEEKEHKKFKEKFSLPFTLVADPKHAIIDKFGVWGEKQLYGRKYIGLHRTTFVIDEKGEIRKVFTRPKNKAHAEEIIKAWEQLKG